MNDTPETQSSKLETQGGLGGVVAYSPAKLNLFLKVLSRKPDGYHNIVSIVDLISLHDTIHIEEEDADRVTVTDDKGMLPDDERNTVYRAIMLLKKRYNIKKGVRAHIEKNIPIGSGLGGPSSNAATTLKALVKVWGLSIGKRELNKLGSIIGADVPLFLHGKPCVMKGIGNRIYQCSLPTLWYLVVYPNVILQTKAVYQGLKIVLTKKENEIKFMNKFDNASDVSSILENDLENVAILMCPTIRTVKERLIEVGAVGALMSGSGSSVFGIFEREVDARKASALMTDMGSIFVTHSLQEGKHYGDYKYQDISCK